MNIVPVKREASYTVHFESAAFTVAVVVTTPDPGGDGLGLTFVCPGESLDSDLEDRIVGATRNAVLQSLEAEGGIPVGGVSVEVRLDHASPWNPSERVGGLLPEMIAFFAATSARLAVEAPATR